MIVVAGFNTAMDRDIRLDARLRVGQVQRAADARLGPGGKGLHVAQMIAELGEPVRLVGLTDPVHEITIAQHLEARGVEWHGVVLPGALRQCLAIHANDGSVTEILERGPELEADTREALLDAVLGGVAHADALVVSGSLPRGFEARTYAGLVAAAAGHERPCLVDTSGEALRLAAMAGPWAVKPNADEAAALVGEPVDSVARAAGCARWLHGRGVACPVVTLGAAGAVGYDGKQAWHVHVVGATVRNAVGSGDCFLAGLAVARVRGKDLPSSLALATACGVANAGNEEAGFAKREQVERVLRGIEVHPVTQTDAGGG